jgi:hypothetical protein
VIGRAFARDLHKPIELSLDISQPAGGVARYGVKQLRINAPQALADRVHEPFSFGRAE